jgi:hypothetical protein
LLVHKPFVTVDLSDKQSVVVFDCQRLQRANSAWCDVLALDGFDIKSAADLPANSNVTLAHRAIVELVIVVDLHMGNQIGVMNIIGIVSILYRSIRKNPTALFSRSRVFIVIFLEERLQLVTKLLAALSFGFGMADDTDHKDHPVLEAIDKERIVSKVAVIEPPEWPRHWTIVLAVSGIGRNGIRELGRDEPLNLLLNIGENRFSMDERGVEDVAELDLPFGRRGVAPLLTFNEVDQKS